MENEKNEITYTDDKFIIETVPVGWYEAQNDNEEQKKLIFTLFIKSRSIQINGHIKGYAYKILDKLKEIAESIDKTGLPVAVGVEELEAKFEKDKNRWFVPDRNMVIGMKNFPVGLKENSEIAKHLTGYSKSYIKQWGFEVYSTLHKSNLGSGIHNGSDWVYVDWGLTVLFQNKNEAKKFLQTFDGYIISNVLTKNGINLTKTKGEKRPNKEEPAKTDFTKEEILARLREKARPKEVEQIEKFIDFNVDTDTLIKADYDRFKYAVDQELSLIGKLNTSDFVRGIIIRENIDTSVGMFAKQYGTAVDDTNILNEMIWDGKIKSNWIPLMSDYEKEIYSFMTMPDPLKPMRDFVYNKLKQIKTKIVKKEPKEVKEEREFIALSGKINAKIKAAIDEIAEKFRIEIKERLIKNKNAFIQEFKDKVLKLNTNKVAELYPVNNVDRRTQTESWNDRSELKQYVDVKGEYKEAAYFLKPDYKSIIEHVSEERSKLEVKQYQRKMYHKLSDLMIGISDANLNVRLGGGSTMRFSEIYFSFDNGVSFYLKNKMIINVSRLGNLYNQYPSTFHDLVIPDQKTIANPSEYEIKKILQKYQTGDMKAKDNIPEKKTEDNMEAKKYEYSLVYRPFSQGYPKENFLQFVDDGTRFGKLVYSEKLPIEKVKSYELSPITEIQEYEGREVYYYENYKAAIKIAANSNGILFVEIHKKDEEENEYDVENLSAIEFLQKIESGDYRMVDRAAKEIPVKKTTHPETNDKPSTETKQRFSNTKEIDRSEITILPELFQGRQHAYSEESVNKIVSEGFDKSNDPIVVWYSPEKKKYVVISGHSRWEASRRLYESGKQPELKTMLVKEFLGDQQEAVSYAVLESNRASTSEGFVSDVNAVRKMLNEGFNKSEMIKYIKPKAYLEKVINYTYLDPAGRFIETLGSDAKISFPYIDRNAEWVGMIRKTYGNKITNAHEKEMFDYFYLEGGKKGLNIRKDDFFKIIDKKVMAMDYDANNPLNLRNIVSTSAITNPVRQLIAETDQEIEYWKSEIDKKRVLIARANSEGLQNMIPQFNDFISSANKKLNDLVNKKFKLESDMKKLDQTTTVDLFSMAATKPIETPQTSTTTYKGVVLKQNKADGDVTVTEMEGIHGMNKVTNKRFDSMEAAKAYVDQEESKVQKSGGDEKKASLKARLELLTEMMEEKEKELKAAKKGSASDAGEIGESLRKLKDRMELIAEMIEE